MDYTPEEIKRAFQLLDEEKREAELDEFITLSMKRRELEGMIGRAINDYNRFYKNYLLGYDIEVQEPEYKREEIEFICKEVIQYGLYLHQNRANGIKDVMDELKAKKEAKSKLMPPKQL